MNYFDVLLAKKLEDTRDPVVKGLSVTENGRYSEENTVYDVVVVDVPETRLTTLNATANGTYTPQEGEAYNEVNVDVPLPSNAYLLKSLTGLPQDIATFTDGADAPLNALTASIELSCAGADIIVSESEIINNKTPYLFRKSAGGNRVLEKLIGGTIVTNQMIENGDFSDGLNGWTILNEGASTITASNNEATITGNTTYNDGVVIELQTTPGHIYYVTASIKSTGNVRFYDGQNIFTDNISSSSDYKRHEHIISVGTLTSQFFILSKQSINTVNIKNVMCIDITKVLGNGAQYIYSLEQSTAGAGVAYFRQMFPNDYYAYDSGTLQSVNVASKKVYDSNNILVATYAFDSDLTLRGIPKLDASNNLYYDGDVYESDGTVTRKYGVVDLGTVNWDKYNNSSKTYFRTSAQLPDAKKSDSPSTTHNLICSNYKEDSWSHVIDGNGYDGNICIGWNNKSYIGIYDSRYVDVSVSDFKTAMSGIYLVYELATPTTESADAYTNPQIVDADGTEEFVDYAQSQGTRDVAVPVGHDSYYYDGTLYSRDFPATISSGSYDIINGVITSGQNTYNTTPLPLRSLVGNNNIYVDCGEITNLEYFTKEQHE